MALIDFLDETFFVMNKISTPDGYGGFVWEWQEGVVFLGKAKKKTSSDLIIAQQQGAKEVFKLFTAESMHFEKGDIVKREKDGAVLRITSDAIDGTPPMMSEIKCVMVYAERVTL